MRMNWLEKALMDGPSKRWMQRHYEAPLFARLGGLTTGQRVLDIGCGNGVGIEIALAHFGAEQVDGLDIDDSQLVRAHKRLATVLRPSPGAGDPRDRVRLLVGDVCEIPAPDGAYDAVFNYLVLHHVIDWQRALAEVHRVLKPGGLFYFEETPGSSLSSWPARVLLDHPTENRFEADEFAEAVRRQGFSVGHIEVRARGNVFFGVGQRGAEAAGPSRIATGRAATDRAATEGRAVS